MTPNVLPSIMDHGAAVDALVHLEHRLKRIEFITLGSVQAGGLSTETHAATDAATRLRKLETRFAALSDSSSAARCLLQLRRSHNASLAITATDPKARYHDTRCLLRENPRHKQLPTGTPTETCNPPICCPLLYGNGIQLDTFA